MKESRIHSVLTAIIDIIYAGLLWLVCSLPVITVGASSSALYYVTVKCIRRERGRIGPNFFHAFRSNFKTATLVWLCYILYFLVCAADGYAVQAMGAGNLFEMSAKLLFLPGILTLPWIFAYISRYENTVGRSLKFAVVLSIRHFGSTLLLVAEFAAFALLIYLLPQLLPLLPGVFCLLQSFRIEPVLKELMPAAEDSNPDPWYNE